MENTLLTSVLPAVIAAMLSFIGALYWTGRKAALDAAALTEAKADTLHQRVDELERQMMAIGTTVQPISAAFQAILVKELTHFHTPVLDALLVKLGPPFTLTADEEKQLAAELAKRERDMGPSITPSERNAAGMLPWLIPRVRAAAERVGAIDVGLVTMPKFDSK